MQKVELSEDTMDELHKFMINANFALKETGQRESMELTPDRCIFQALWLANFVTQNLKGRNMLRDMIKTRFSPNDVPPRRGEG